jgi:hypothetical protein
MAERDEIKQSLRENNGLGVLAAKTLQQLALEYDVSKETMRNWLEPFSDEIGERQGNIYKIWQVQVIYEKLGTP